MTMNDNDNHYEDNLEAVALLYCPYRSQHYYMVLLKYYLFPHCLSTDPGINNHYHFAHFADKQHCFYCVMHPAVFVLSS